MESHLRVGDLVQSKEDNSIIGLVVHVDPKELFGEVRIVSILCSSGHKRAVFSNQLRKANS